MEPNDFSTFDPMSVDLDDVDMDFVEDPETGAISYEKPEPTEEAENADEEGDWNPEPEQPAPATLLNDIEGDAVVLVHNDKQFTANHINELVSRSDDIVEKSEYLNDLSDRIAKAEKHLEQGKFRAGAEIDKKVKALEELLEGNLDDTQRGAYERQLRQQRSLQKELDDEYNHKMTIIAGEKEEDFRKRVRETDEYMIAKYGKAWVNEVSDVYQYALGTGITEKTLKEALCPAMAFHLVQSRKWAQFEAARKQKANQEIKASFARSKSPAKRTPRMEEPKHNTAAQQRLMSGDHSRQTLVDSFDPSWV